MLRHGATAGDGRVRDPGDRRALRSRITGGATREELKDAIERTGSFKTMEDSCRELVLTGVTTVEEARKTITALE